jgi:glycerate dehydrogenase
MNIVVIDGETLNPGDLSWDGLSPLGTVTVYPRTAPGELVTRCRDAEAVITNKVAFDAAAIAALPRLRYLGVTATGYNIVDTAAAAARGVVVTNVPTYGTDSVAQMTFALILELAHHVGHHARTVREGRWSAGTSFSYWDYPLLELAGLTLGIVGYGRIGRAVARLGAAFGMRPIAHDTVAGTEDLAERVDLDAVFSRSDVVCLHCPLTPETAGIASAARIALMKPSAFLVNTSRGPLVDERSLAEALDAGRIAGAGLDVLAAEPPKGDNPLLHAKNCIITPHIAWATRAARGRLLAAGVENLRAFAAGTPTNVVGGTGKGATA